MSVLWVLISVPLTVGMVHVLVVPYCGAFDQLHDDAWQKQWQKANDCAHCETCL